MVRPGLRGVAPDPGGALDASGVHAMCADRNRLDDTPDDHAELSLVGDPVIDLTTERRAAEIDHAAGVAARNDALWLLRQSAILCAAATEAAETATTERENADIDDLTGALRRHQGFRAMRRDVDRAGRGDGLLVVGFLDVDGLKHVNDNHGHHSGDLLLRNVVATLRASLRSYDVVVRYGGDEFVYAMAGVTMRGALRRYATMCALLEKRAEGRTVSVGFAELRPDD